MKRPEISYGDLKEIDHDRPELTLHQRQCVEVRIKYEGYIRKQMAQIERFKTLEKKKLSTSIPYESIEGLRIEASQKLASIKPASVGQASRISGVSPADISVLLIWLEKMGRGGAGTPVADKPAEKDLAQAADRPARKDKAQVADRPAGKDKAQVADRPAGGEIDE
jgi:hypothetical protein